MKVIIVNKETQSTITVDISDDEDVVLLKEMIKIENDINVERQIISFNGKIVRDGTLKSNGACGDEWTVELRVADEVPSSVEGAAAPLNRAMCIGDIPATATPEEYLRLVGLHPHLLNQYRNNDVEFADALSTNDVGTVRKLLMLRHMGLHKRNFSQQQELARIDRDPTNEDNQRKIAEMIRLQNIQANMENAMENMPEAFGRVTMLYIDVKVNREPVKCFVDSGAQSTIMTARCVERVGLSHLIDTRFKGEARGVGTAKILGRIHIADMQLGSNFYPVSITVLEGGDVDFLLGLDMLKHHRAILNMATSTLTFEGGEAVSFLSENQMPARARGNYTEAGADEDNDELAAAIKKSRLEDGSSTSSGDVGTGVDQNNRDNAAGSASSGAVIGSTEGDCTAKPQSRETTNTGSSRSAEFGGSSASAASTGPPAPPTSHAEQVRYLCDLGFTPSEAEGALSQAAGDVFLAASMLLLSKE